ncbi:chromatin SPT2 [Purpureocillium lilacinum]|uniref:Chromatin SPT2 n=1 Tax=Purpureocillium lilacinum TaxID=33203 RepID=A0A179HAZ0_PURLI|nr:chromatin SPT2 [Purpureocillium lilacinum]OAQ87314.1 chromatin SPT2 [Purpureocillium lilacinum]OAQ95265.1 chromatin SPT2 [Purpureocillium lilacinum]PWI71304.1 SPT2 chromatin protein [Purpureocillium lilacinum]
MPIGDLLAQITGDQSTAGSARTPTLPRGSQVPTKRKPDDDLRGNAAKAVRHVPPSQRPSQGSRPTSDKPSPSQRPATNDLKVGVVDRSKPTNAASKPVKPLGSGARPTVNKAPAPAPAAPRVPPKKGSFAEILARGQRAQAVMGQVGKIQHKKVEKGAARSKDDAKAAPPVKSQPAQAKSKPATGYSGTSKAAPRNGVNGHGTAGKKDSRNTPPARPKAGTSRREAEEEAAKKVKKAALVNTGYSGTARPKPAETGHRKKETPRGGALLNAPMSRGSSKRSRYEEDYDEELDDFIEYDDEEDEGPRYGYESDGSSDMEAGLDELDVEERRAEYLARKEDIEEERLEKTLKAAKEDRKRKAMEQLRARRR